MIAVIFEFEPKADQVDAYFDLAAEMRGLVTEVDGFISNERFESVTQPGKFVSLSFWRDEAALAAWRKLSAHRSAQSQGRARIFDNYRLRVVSVMRDYTMTDREQAPADSKALHG